MFWCLDKLVYGHRDRQSEEKKDEKKISKKQKFFLSFVSNSRSQLSRHTFIRERFSFEKKKKKLKKKKKKEKTKKKEEPQRTTISSRTTRARATKATDV